MAARPHRRPGTAGLVWRAGLSAVATAGLLGLLAQRLGTGDLAVAGRALAGIAPGQWLAAGLGVTLSLWAIGRYDRVMQGHLAAGRPGADLPAAAVARAGVAAITLAQAVGLGLVTGTAVRHRLCPGLGLGGALRLTLAVTLSFLGCWAVLTALMCLWAGWSGAREPALAVLGAALALWVHQALRAGRPGPLAALPNALTLLRLLALCALDMAGAALALAALLPAGTAVALPYLLAAFHLAYGAGLVAGTPAGVGSFDMALMALLPGVEPAQLLAATVAWRLAYVLGPAVLGLALVLAGPPAVHRPASPRLPAQPLRAEYGLAGHDGVQMLACGPSLWLAGRRGHHLIALLGPATPCPAPQALAALSATARREGRLALVHKAPARLALAGRRAGWTVLRSGWEAVLNPARFDLATPARAGLRRKLRHAERAGICADLLPPGAPPPAELQRLSDQWETAHGGARGFSMGRFQPALLAQQVVVVARAQGRVLAFVSFHRGANEWTLDLMRHGPDLPDGTMHLLIVTAIRAAAQAGVTQISLAAVSDLARRPARAGPRRWLGRLAPALADPGLYRFKSSFAPGWRPLYLMAPGRLALATGALSLARAICHPPKADLQPIEQDDAEYGFALAPAPWHIAGNP